MRGRRANMMVLIVVTVEPCTIFVSYKLGKFGEHFYNLQLNRHCRMVFVHGYFRPSEKLLVELFFGVILIPRDGEAGATPSRPSAPAGTLGGRIAPTA